MEKPVRSWSLDPVAAVPATALGAEKEEEEGERERGKLFADQVGYDHNIIEGRYGPMK